MKKISWFWRIFMSYDKLQEHFANVSGSQPLGKLVQEKDARISELRKWLEEKNTKISELNTEIGKLKGEQENLKNNLNVGQNDLAHSKTQELKITREYESLKSKLEQQINQINDFKKSEAFLKNEVNEKLKTIGKIEKTFFASTGNKGKGEMGEIQVKLILEKAGLTREFWTENLQVGSKNIEFAIRSGESDKWIPIDSKVIEAYFDEEQKAIIDDKYKQRVRDQAKKIAEYLNKKNTASYGILVIQSDEIYMTLYEQFPDFFREMINQYKVYVASPSSFVQFAWSVSQIMNVYEKVHKDEKIYNEMVSLLDSVTKFANKLAKVHTDFKIAMETHYPAIENKGSKFKNKIDKFDKIKKIEKI